MSYSALYSPLAHQDFVQEWPKALLSNDILKSREDSFINDAVKTVKYNAPRRIPIIPAYDALRDRSLRGYFQSANVKEVISVTIYGQEPTIKENSINKLSSRRRCPPTPPREKLAERQKSFVNDAIITEKQRTKYTDTVLPRYEPLEDKLCEEYHHRPDVLRLLRSTRPEAFTADSRLPSSPTSLTQSVIYTPRKSESPLPRSKTSLSAPQLKTMTSMDMSRSSSNGSTNRVHLTSRSLPEVPLASNPRKNKLSYRRLCMPTPSPEKLREREIAFVNDGVKTEKSRTRFRDILPAYTAIADDHCRAYFKRPDVQRLLSRTSPQESTTDKQKKPATTS